MDYRRHYENDRRGGRRDWTDRAGDEMRSWFGDDEARLRRERDEREERYRAGAYGGERDRGFGPYADRPVHGREAGYGDDGGRFYGETYGSRQPYEPAYGPSARDAARHGRDDVYEGEPYRAGARERGGAFDTGSGYGNGGRAGPWSGWRGADDAWGAPLDRWRSGAGGPNGSQGFRGKGPRDYQRSDDRIREDVSDRLTDDPGIDASDVTVRVQRCEVTLAGTVNSREEKRRAEDLAERISGVSEVINNLRVSRAHEGLEADASSGTRRAQGARPASSRSGESGGAGSTTT